MPDGLTGFGPSGFALSYEEMQKWYCGKATNTAKPVCATATKGAKGPHPLFNKKHAQHLDWVEMTKGFCALPVNQKKFVCLMQKAQAARASKMAGKGLGSMAKGPGPMAKGPGPA